MSFSDFFSSLHFGTRCLLVLIVSVYVLQLTVIDRALVPNLCLIPAAVFRGEIWRLLTSAVLHGVALHVAMNALAFAQLGVTLEARIGTCALLCHIVAFALLTSAVHCCIALAALAGGERSAYHGASLGFSGVLFALIVIDVSASDPGARAVLGLFAVPAWLYPWVMLLVMQLLVHNASFVGHLSGMVVGYAYHFGLLRCVVPRQAAFAELERRVCCARQSFGYVSAEGQVVGQYRPWTVFRHTWGRGDDGQVLPRAGAGDGAFRGQPRTLGGETPEQAPEL
jgi:membrane associated rhomboid family serine protease